MTKPALTCSHLNSVHVPDWRKGNPYQSLLGVALESQDVGVQWRDIPQCIFPLNRLRGGLAGINIIHLHWSNDIVGGVVWADKPVKRALRLALMIADVWLVRLRGRQVIWTIHNLVTHESTHPSRELYARRWLAWSCNTLIFHSNSALQRVETAYRLRLRHKGRVIPHGNYNGVYPPNPARTQELRAEFQLENSSIVLLFFGAIREYKRIPQIVESFRRTSNLALRLIIAGSARPPELAQAIEAAIAGDRRIHFRPGFVVDSDVCAYFDLADAALIPMERTLTSGSTVLSMTMGKATILHEEGRVFDLADTATATGYFYKSDAELTELLDSLDKAGLSSLGPAACSAVESHDWESVAKATAAAYRANQR